MLQYMSVAVLYNYCFAHGGRLLAFDSRYLYVLFIPLCF